MSTVRQNWWFPILLFVQCVAIAILVFSPATLAAPLAVNSCPEGMVLIPGGTFTIGSDDSGFVEERAATDVTLNPFCIDTYEITNAQFSEFVKATGYVTIAERSLSKEQFPGLPDEQRLPGSLVFQMAQAKQVSWLGWWHWTPGANWQHPFGPDSTIAARENYPVVHIAYQDAAAYAQWAGKSLSCYAAKFNRQRYLYF